jgi:flagellar motor switch protein FliG
MSPAPEAALSGPQKAAILMVLLGDEAAKTICQHLPKEQLRLLAEEITGLGGISPEMAATVLQEYKGRTVTKETVGQGGPDFATQLLVKTFGDEGSRPLVDQVVRSQEITAKNFEALEKADPQQLMKLLQQEHPQTVALVLAHLNSNAARTVLLLLPDELRTQSVRRLAEMQNFSPDVLKKISTKLRSKLVTPDEQDRRSYVGVKTVADLLNRMGAPVTSDILASIEKDNTTLAASIRNQMFTFEDFLEVPDTGLRELLSQSDKKLLATALKGASENLKNHFFKCMSSRAVEMMKEDMDTLGPLKAKDVTQAQTDIVAVARKLEAEGKMTLKSETEEAYVV